MESHPSPLKYTRILPADDLKGHVQYFWTLESEDNDPLPKILGPLADGCPGIIFQQPEEGTFFDQYHHRLHTVFLYGQTVKRTKICLIGNFRTIGICFFPDTLKSVFGFNASVLTDACLDLDLISVNQNINLSDRLLNAPSTGDKIEILTSYLLTEIRRNNKEVDLMTQYALSKIIGSKGKIPLRELQKSLGLSERSLERKFEQQVGIPPKLFSRVCRFQAALSQLRNNHYDRLSDIAFDNGYTDQSHFIKTFKEFAGYSPQEFRKQSGEAGERFPVPVR